MIICIVIVDDYLMVVEGIQVILEIYDDIEVVGVFCNGQQVVDCVEEFNFDVILLDLNMLEINGLLVIEMILECWLEMCILILLMYDWFEYIFLVLNYGVCGYIFKDVLIDEICYVIDVVMFGE